MRREIEERHRLDAEEQERRAEEEREREREFEREQEESRRRIDETVDDAQRNIERSTRQAAAAERATARPAMPMRAAAAIGSGLTTTANAVGSAKIKLFLIIIIGLHVWDLLSGYNRIGPNFVWWLTVYALLALVGAPFFLDDGEGWLHTFLSRKVFVFVGVSVVAFLLPIIISKLPDALITNATFRLLIGISAPWVIFLFVSGTEDRMVVILRNFWLIVWIVFFLALIFRSINGLHTPSQLQGSYDINIGDAIKEVFGTIKDSFSKTFKRIIGVPVSITSFVNRNINDSVGRDFSGQVDPYANGDLGVRFTQLRAYQDRFMSGQDVVVWADIQGETFNDQINVELRCYAQSTDGKVYNGTVRTQNGLDGRVLIQMREKVSASCTFEGLPKGNYNVWFTGVFVFETWSYIQYYFAPDELVKNMWQQDLDPAREAGIPERPVSIFTSGPVNLGLASERDQPIPVNPYPGKGMSPDRTLPPFGASIINQWTDGEVLSVRQITLLVPDPFLLKDCDRDPVLGSRKDPRGERRSEMEGYREYTFGNIGGSVNGLDRVNVGFESVTCYLGFSPDKEQNAASLIGGYDLVMKTFAARTNYLYMIKDDTQVKVVDDGY